MTPMQCRAARAALGWNLQRLAEQAGVAINTANSFERGRDVLYSNVNRIQAALEAAGVTFLQDDGDGPGVRVREPDGG